MFKSGFVAIIGRPNVGKSTLLNALLKKHLSIISPKPQTTRNSIQGIMHLEDAQIVFVDTPGIHSDTTALDTLMNQESYDALQDVDIILYIIDATKFYGMDENIIKVLKKNTAIKFLILNKIDLLKRDQIIKILGYFHNNELFKEIIPMSIIKNVNLEVLEKLLIDNLKEGPKYYPEETISDKSDDFHISELIREKILKYTEEEIPHGTHVYVESIKKYGQKGLTIQAVIVVEKDSHKGIIIGKNGQKLRQIGSLARKDIERFMNAFIDLRIFVKVEKNWKDKNNLLKEYGFKK
jgi:GTP-binding protein Era